MVDVSDVLFIGIGGIVVGKIFEGDCCFNVVVCLDDVVCNDLD